MGTAKQITDGSFLLFHKKAPNNPMYHIHIVNTSDDRMGFASVREKYSHPKNYT